jgi:Tripartite tricarboxylate transporter family receptor
LATVKLPRRHFLHLAAGVAALPAVSRIAWAQTYPTRPVRWIVGFAAGGGNDITARLMGQRLTERLGQPFVIENRPGAGTNIAAEVVVNAPPDGYTLFFANVANAVNATLYEKLNFDFIRDITPVAGIMRVPNIMAVSPSVPAKTVPELIVYAKANPGRVNMASAGIGTTGQSGRCRRRNGRHARPCQGGCRRCRQMVALLCHPTRPHRGGTRAMRSMTARSGTLGEPLGDRVGGDPRPRCAAVSLRAQREAATRRVPAMLTWLGSPQ